MKTSVAVFSENDSVSIEEQTPESMSTAISTEDRSLIFCEDKSDGSYFLLLNNRD